MTTVDLTNLTPDDLLALDARIKDLQAQREAEAAAQPAPEPEPVTPVAAPPTVDVTTTTTDTTPPAPEEPTPESLLDALGVSHTSNQIANAKAWIESHLGITLP